MSDFGELPLDRMIPSWLVCLQVDCNHQFVPSAFQVRSKCQGSQWQGYVKFKINICLAKSLRFQLLTRPKCTGQIIGGFALEINHM